MWNQISRLQIMICALVYYSFFSDIPIKISTTLLSNIHRMIISVTWVRAIGDNYLQLPLTKRSFYFFYFGLRCIQYLILVSCKRVPFSFCSEKYKFEDVVFKSKWSVKARGHIDKRKNKSIVFFCFWFIYIAIFFKYNHQTFKRPKIDGIFSHSLTLLQPV